jgi:hypothetical protein
MGDQLLPLPLTERTVHLCMDVQRIISADGPSPTSWMDRVLPAVGRSRTAIPMELFLPVSFRRRCMTEHYCSAGKQALEDNA